jgi:hypothetical protein
MIIGKKDKLLVESLKSDILFLQNVNDNLVKRYMNLSKDYKEVVSIDKLLTLSGLTIMELSNISNINLQELLDSNIQVTIDVYDKVLRSLFDFFLRNTN